MGFVTHHYTSTGPHIPDLDGCCSLKDCEQGLSNPSGASRIFLSDWVEAILSFGCQICLERVVGLWGILVNSMPESRRRPLDRSSARKLAQYLACR